MPTSAKTPGHFVRRITILALLGFLLGSCGGSRDAAPRDAGADDGEGGGRTFDSGGRDASDAGRAEPDATVSGDAATASDAGPADGGAPTADASTSGPGCAGGDTVAEGSCTLDLAVVDGPAGRTVWVRGAVGGLPRDGCASLDDVDLYDETGAHIQHLDPRIDVSGEVFDWAPAGVPVTAVTELCDGDTGRFTPWEAEVTGTTATGRFRARCGGASLLPGGRVAVTCHRGVSAPATIHLQEQLAPDVGLELRASFDPAETPVSYTEMNVVFLSASGETRSTSDWINDPMAVFPLVRVLPLFEPSPLGDWCPHIDDFTNSPYLMVRIRGQLEGGRAFVVEDDVGECVRTSF